VSELPPADPVVSDAKYVEQVISLRVIIIFRANCCKADVCARRNIEFLCPE